MVDAGADRRAAFRRGDIIIVVDDADRENEGDLTIAAEKVTPAAINFMMTHGRGLICLPMTAERLDTLQIPLQVPAQQNSTQFETAFCIGIEAKKGTVEEWVIRNKTPMYHPIHLHSWPFQVQGQEGWQDVVQVAPYTEQVIRVAYDDFGGTTVLHCHILDHEDTGMMAIIRVQ